MAAPFWIPEPGAGVNTLGPGKDDRTGSSTWRALSRDVSLAVIAGKLVIDPPEKKGGSPFGPRPPHAGPSPRSPCAWRAVTHWLAPSHVYVSLHVYVTAFVRIYRCTHDTQASISQCRTTRRACSATEREEKIGIRGGDNPIEIPRRARPGRMLNGIPRAPAWRNRLAAIVAN